MLAGLQAGWFQFLTGSRFHFYLCQIDEIRLWKRDLFQFLTGSRFHFYEAWADELRKVGLSFNSLQEVGFISTAEAQRLALQEARSFNSLQEVGFISTSQVVAFDLEMNCRFNSLQEVGFISTVVLPAS